MPKLARSSSRATSVSVWLSGACRNEMWLESIPPSSAWNQLHSWTRLEMSVWGSGRRVHSSCGSGGGGGGGGLSGPPRRPPRRSQVRPDHPASLLARIGDVADLRGEARLRRLARHLEAAAVSGELPAVVGAAHPVLVDAAEVEGGQPVRAELADETGPAALAPEGDQGLAEEPDPLDTAAGLDLA